MEGPTPVSALIHSATMVIAGIFLIIKCSFIIEFSKDILIFIVYVGIITSIVTSLIGFFQHDIKKIIAYSTCSQLGYMFFCCGLSGYYYSLFHLFNHAFFKSLLFLSSGFIIHYFLNEQDTRKMGSLSKIIPVTYVIIFIASLSLIGFPFLSGFF
jgi:NADH-ubiquinone oxidoreductase chain 5